jgi:hypothetical protein
LFDDFKNIKIFPSTTVNNKDIKMEMKEERKDSNKID